MDLDFKELLSGALQGSSIVDTAISQVFGTSPIEMKLKEIGYLLEKHSGMSNFEYYFDVRSLAYNYRVSFEGDLHYGTIADSALRDVPVAMLVKQITYNIMSEITNIDPEYMFENENEQAMLDAAMDYGFV